MSFLNKIKRELFGNVYRKIAIVYILVLTIFFCLIKILVTADQASSPQSSKNSQKTIDKLADKEGESPSGDSNSDQVSSQSATTNSKSKSTSSSTSTDSSSSDTNDGSSSNNTEDNSPSSTPTSTPTSQPTVESALAYVAFYADSQSDTDEEDARHQKVVNRILSSSANPVMHGGDVMEDGTQNSLDRFNAVTTTLRATRSFYSVLGNNDRKIGDSSTPSQLFLDNFSFPNNERWYSINTGNLHMVFLDSAFCASCQSQIDWLVSDLQSSASQSRITGVIYHHPSFSSTLSSYLESNGVDFVIQGHEHVYRHTTSGGINYFVMPGGSSLGYALASIYSNNATINFYNENGGLIDSVSFNER